MCAALSLSRWERARVRGRKDSEALIPTFSHGRRSNHSSPIGHEWSQSD